MLDLLRTARIDLETIWERRTIKRARHSRAKRGSVTSGTRHVLVAGPGGGSIGDEAMYEAFVRECDGPLTVISTGDGDLLWKDSRPDTRYVEIPGLLYGTVRERAESLQRFERELDEAASLSVVGADVMDGVYSALSSTRRFRLIELGAAHGVPSRVLGFSWNLNPNSRALSAMLRADKVGTLCARDQKSGSRLRSSGATNVEVVADLAFLTTPDAPINDSELQSWITDQRSQNKTVVVVNANPRQEARFPGLRGSYIELINTLIKQGIACVLLPHDSRGGSKSEESYISGIAGEFAGRDDIYHVKYAPLPDQIVAISRESDLVVSGRMHLVVLSSVGGRSSVAFDYQDKFEGLYELLGYDGRIPMESGASTLLARVGEALEQRELREAALSGAWGEVVRRSRLNLPFK